VSVASDWQLLTVWAGRVTINILPDDVLLHVFRFDRLSYLDRWKDDVNRWRRSWEWYRLVHVCRRWRSVVFSWPNFLDLKLVCGPGTHVEHTGIWPPLPIIIRNMVNWHMPNNYDFDAAIVHPNRVCEVNLLHLTSLQLQRLASAMERQFPALIHLKLDFDLDSDNSGPAPALPDGFLGGSAPRLRTLGLQSIPFPALPKLLLSATELVRLTLWNIPLSGYMPPEAIVTGLAVLANLKCLTIGFRSPLSFPYLESRLPLPQIRTVLPALTRFKFQGISEYLEVLVAQIDAPLLESIHCTFFQHQLDIPQLTQFMERTMLECEMNYDFLLVHVIGTRFESFDIG
jgi:hypothetical protein